MRPGLRRLAVVLPLLLAATVLPIVRPASQPRVRQWTMDLSTETLGETLSQALGQRLKAPGDFSLVGLSAPKIPTGPIEVRVSRDGRRWGRWTAIEFEAEVGPDRDSHETGAHTSMPLWTGPNRHVQVRGAPGGSKIHAVDPGPDPVAPTSSAMASPTKPGIITRSQWGADESIRKGKPSYASSLKLAVVHHTATSDSYAKSESDNIVRAIYAYHVKTNGWDDIGYNFLVDRYGQIFEGRYGGVDRNVVGAHSMGFNTSSTGVSIIGNFASSKPPSIAMNSLKRILAWRLDQGMIDPESSVSYTSNGSNKYPKGQTVKLKRVIGHRDVGQTACPGNPLQGTLPWLRWAAKKDGLPKFFDGKVSRAAITPNGDGYADALKVTGRFSSTINWKVSFVDSSGTSHHAVSGSGTTLSVNFYGKNSSGAVLPHGSYRARVTGKGSAGSLRGYEMPFKIFKWANGTFMYTTKKITFILTKGKLRHPSHYSSRATHYKASEYVVVPATITKYYPKSSWIGFREGSIVSAGGKVYLISEGKKRPTSKSALASKGFDTSGIIATTTRALEPHATGSTFSSGSAIPNGVAIRGTTGTEGWLLRSVGRRFASKAARTSFMIRDADFAQPADDLLAAGATSDPIGFRDGTLIRLSGDSKIYMISDRMRRVFPSSSVFTRMGFKSANIRSVTPAEFAVHSEGKSL